MEDKVKNFYGHREDTMQETQSQMIAACSELGAFYRRVGQYERSLAIFEKAKALVEDGDEQYASILNNMGGTYRLIRDYGNAEDCFLAAMDCCRLRGMQEDYAFAGILMNLSLVYQENNQADRAIEYLEQALSLMENMPERRQETAVAYNNLTTLYHAAGDEVNAMRCLNRALQEFEKCPDEERVHYAAVLNSLAGFLYCKGDDRRALTLYSKSAEYTRRFFGETMEYGTTLQNMRWVCENMGRRKAAIAILEKAKTVYERLLGEDHERTRIVADDLQRLREDHSPSRVQED